jgi:hypothetical protein
VVDRSEHQEHCDGRSDPDIDERLSRGQSGAWRSCGRCGCDRDGEVARKGQDQHRLNGTMNSGEPKVPSAEVGRSLFGQLNHEHILLVTTVGLLATRAIFA